MTGDGDAAPWAIGDFNLAGLDGEPVPAVSPLRIADCTLRDGEQQAGVVFTAEDKVELARAIDGLGIYELELGTPAASDEDREAIAEIVGLGLRARLSALARAREEDIEMVAQLGVQGVRVSLPISDRQRAAKLSLDDDAYVALALRTSAAAKERDLEVIFSPYDTTRCDLGLLRRLLREFSQAGCVDRVRVVDTVGSASPEAVRYLVGVMRESAPSIPVEVHCHDDFGLATANTVAGALAGAQFLSTTMNGIGERSGNAPLEEVVMALKVLYGVDLGIRTERLAEVSAEVVRRSAVALQPHKPVVGSNSFTHETGMVVAGLLKDPYTAEAYDPRLVGRERSIVVGKKSGRASLEYKLRTLGIELAEDVMPTLLEEVKREAIRRQRTLTDDELRQLASG